MAALRRFVKAIRVFAAEPSSKWPLLAPLSAGAALSATINPCLYPAALRIGRRNWQGPDRRRSGPCNGRMRSGSARGDSAGADRHALVNAGGFWAAAVAALPRQRDGLVLRGCDDGLHPAALFLHLGSPSVAWQRAATAKLPWHCGRLRAAFRTIPAMTGSSRDRPETDCAQKMEQPLTKTPYLAAIFYGAGAHAAPPPPRSCRNQSRMTEISRP